MPRVLALMAHPDDIEITCAGTLILLKDAGWDVHMATMTAGDLGSSTLPAAAIARIRRKEAAASARLLGAGYTCLGIRDLTIAHTERQKRIVTGLLRAVRPDVLITHPPVDYMADHEQTSYLARDAAFGSTIPNWKALPPIGVRAPRRPAPPCDALPALLFADPIDLATPTGARAAATHVVDISPVIERKAAMLAAHASQRAWLHEQHGEDEYLHWMRRVAVERARDIRRRSVTHAEGFVPYLGHAFPRHDVLTKALGRKVVRSAMP
ncbi:MAG: PIG-L family deacetylase [Acidobacteria bacterium]|nr:PIG-L family deacetylase [Acidobacteriota bacterium]